MNDLDFNYRHQTQVLLSEEDVCVLLHFTGVLFLQTHLGIEEFYQ